MKSCYSEARRVNRAVGRSNDVYAKSYYEGGE